MLALYITFKYFEAIYKLAADLADSQADDL